MSAHPSWSSTDTSPGEDNDTLQADSLQDRVMQFEATRTKACVGVLLRLLLDADADFLPPGTDPKRLFMQKAQASLFEPLSAALKRTKQFAADVENQCIFPAEASASTIVKCYEQPHCHAVALYALALLELYPWVNSATLFSSDAAFEGIAPLTTEL